MKWRRGWQRVDSLVVITPASQDTNTPDTGEVEHME